MKVNLNIGDKVKVCSRIGEVIGLNPRGNCTIVKIAFEEGSAKYN